jgi:hypothetical protein
MSANMLEGGRRRYGNAVRSLRISIHGEGKRTLCIKRHFAKAALHLGEKEDALIARAAMRFICAAYGGKHRAP